MLLLCPAPHCWHGLSLALPPASLQLAMHHMHVWGCLAMQSPCVSKVVLRARGSPFPACHASSLGVAALQSTLGAEQLSWFLNDIARINRTQTPWVIATWHAPVVR